VGLGRSGDNTLEGEVGVSHERRMTGLLEGWNAFAALEGQLRAGTQQIERARRALFRLGLIRHRRGDSFSIYLAGFFGTDVGYYTQSDVSQIGFGLAWVPDAESVQPAPSP